MRPLWSVNLSDPVRGLALARERGWLLAWAGADRLVVLDAAGERLASGHAPAPLAAVAAADDGSAFAAAGTDGRVWRLGPDLSVLWERRLPKRALAVAVGPFGQHVAAADAGAGLALFDGAGRPVARVALARAAPFLAFAVEQPRLVASADFGLVAAFDMGGRCLWRDGPVAHVGALAVSGAGAVTLACFSEGLGRYGADGRRVAGPGGPFCRLAAVSYAGHVTLTAGTGAAVRVAGPGAAFADWTAPSAPAAVALDALGTRAVVAADGAVLALGIEARR